MVLGAIIGAVAGIGSSIFGSSSASSAADEQYRMLKKQAEREYERNLKEWEISYQQSLANWEWDRARIAQLRYNERQAEADYNWYNGKLIEAAKTNLAINEGAIRDRYIVEENLRMRQVKMDYNYGQRKLADESNEQLRQYLTGINERVLNSKMQVSQATRENQELVSSLVLDQQRDQLGWQISSIQSMVRDAENKGLQVVRQGGGASSKRMAADAARALGRQYGELEIAASGREARMGLANRAITSELANSIAMNALSVQDSADRMKFVNDRYVKDYTKGRKEFRQLVIPSFKLAGRQGERELQSLLLETQQVIDKASMPYRKQTYFDPLKPIAGLKPELVSPIKPSGVSTIGMIGNALLGGFNGAMQFSYQKPGGGLGFY